jgi:hypothetical protein
VRFYRREAENEYYDATSRHCEGERNENVAGVVRLPELAENIECGHCT